MAPPPPPPPGLRTALPSSGDNGGGGSSRRQQQQQGTPGVDGGGSSQKRPSWRNKGRDGSGDVEQLPPPPPQGAPHIAGARVPKASRGGEQRRASSAATAPGGSLGYSYPYGSPAAGYSPLPQQQAPPGSSADHGRPLYSDSVEGNTPPLPRAFAAVHGYAYGSLAGAFTLPPLLLSGRGSHGHIYCAPFAGYTPPPPRGGSSQAGRSSSRGGRGRGQAAASATPISVPRQRQQRHSGSSTPGSMNGSHGTPPHFGSSSGPNTGGMSSSRKAGRHSTYYADHLPSSLLQQGLKGGMLFRAVLRINPSDRTQAYCTLPGLPTDVFVRGLKLQNRAVEGDEVAIRLLPPADWYQLASSKQAATATAAVDLPGRSPLPPQPCSPTVAPAGVCGSVVPLLTRLGVANAGGALPLTPLTAAVGGGPAAMTPPAWAGLQQQLPMGDLVASPALAPSASGGELNFAVGPTPIGSGVQGRTWAAAEEGRGDDSSKSGSVSSEGGLAEEEEEAMLATVEEGVMGLHLDTDIAGMLASSDALPSAFLGTPMAAAAANEEQQEAGQEKGEDESDEPESLADFLVKEVPVQHIQWTAAAVAAAGAGCASNRVTVDAAAAAASSSMAAGSGMDPRLNCWHPTGSEPAAVLAQIAEQLRQMKGWRATGEVVAVLEPSRRRESVVGVLKQEGDKDTGTFFLIPCDPRLPRMMVRSATLPTQIKQALKTEAQTLELAARTLVSARLTAWDTGFPFPLAQVRSSLGQAGDLASETVALLSMEQVQDDDRFTPEVLACLPPTPWGIDAEELARRRDFRQHRVFSIDPPTARDLDDALSVEELPGGCYRVGVHIADVSHFVCPNSALDREAQQRSTSVYLVDRVIPMLPRLLCEELCSLNPGVDRLAFSVVWDLSPEGDILSTWAGRSVIRSCGKLAYPHVQSMIEGRYLALEGQEPPCKLSGSHSWPDVVKDSLTLHRIASSLRKRRFDSGALRLDNTRLYFKLDEEGNPCDYGVYEQREANQLVEEFMLLANMTTARMVAEHFPDRALLRCHPPPNMHKMVELSTTAAELGFHLDTSGAGPLQKSLSSLRESASTDPAALEVLTLLATKPMQNARYFCTGEMPDESFWRHFALAVTHYTHFTSPIRRYPDIIVHRLMAALLDEAGSKAQRVQQHGLYGTREVGIIAAHANGRKMGAKSVQDGSLRLYLCVMLHHQPLVCDAVIMQLGGSRFFDAYIPTLGCDVRIHTNSLLRGGGAAICTAWRAEGKILELRHATSDPEQHSEQEEPDYSDIPNLGALRNPVGIPSTELPITLRMLSHVPILVSSRRSQTSGSPTHVIAKLWLKSALRRHEQGPGAGAVQQQQQQQGGYLQEVMTQGTQDMFD